MPNFVFTKTQNKVIAECVETLSPFIELLNKRQVPPMIAIGILRAAIIELENQYYRHMEDADHMETMETLRDMILERLCPEGLDQLPTGVVQ